jgi:hypothetical protein
MTKQVGTKRVGLRGVMRSAAFVRGFNEARSGVAMDYDAYQERGQTNTRWDYERGRLLGLIYQGPLKYGHRVADSAVRAMHDAYHQRLVR